MTTVKSLTFTIGATAAKTVGARLEHASCSAWRIEPTTFTRHIEKMLAQGSFEVQLASQRLIWQDMQPVAGILYIIQADGLATINLLLARNNPSAIDELERALGNTKEFSACTDFLRKQSAPLIATFCRADGIWNPSVESTLFMFSAVYFNLQGDRPGTFAPYRSQSAAAAPCCDRAR
jgi:hypothetical protein